MKYLFLVFQIVLIVLLILLVAIFVVVMSSENPKWIFDLLGVAEKGEPKYKVLKFLGIGMGGILVALQALMSYKRAKAMEDTAQAQADAANAQARATEEQAKANQHTEQGQRQERFRNAIEHLGHEKDSVRLGGAYELFHLAKDTEDLRQTVLDILCAHIRRTTGESEYRETHKSKPSEEVQSLLTLLFVQKHEVFKGCHINLQGSWLNGADLKMSRLWKARLTQAYLQGTELDRAHLQRANLIDAHLEEAFLHEAQLQDANLRLARLQGANLKKARLQSAYLFSAWLQATDLQKAHMQGANLASARLQGANLKKALLQGADITWASLIGADLNQACLEGVGSQSWSISIPFADRIRMSICKETDLSKVWFGGIEQEEMDALIKGLSPGTAEILRIKLKLHIGKPESNQLPENSGAIIGSYTKEDAEKWIAEYEGAMSEVPTDDN